jgi:isoleucyl-tRNA synthetase
MTMAIESFVSDLSTWYIRRSRDRKDNFDLLFTCFDNLVKLTAPFTPYISEVIYQNMNGVTVGNSTSSVHLEAWPQHNNQAIDKTLETQMNHIRTICQLVHGQRQLAGIKVRQPLAKVSIDINLKLAPELVDIIAQETNIKEVVLNMVDGETKVTIDTVLTQELIEEGESRDLIRAIQVLRKEGGYQVDDRIKIFCPQWPKKFEAEILSKTLADSIEVSDTLHVK